MYVQKGTFYPPADCQSQDGLYSAFKMAIRYYQVAKDSVTYYAQNTIEHRPVQNSSYTKPVEQREDIASKPQQQDPPSLFPLKDPSPPQLDTDTVKAECQDSAFTAFCGVPSDRMPSLTAPSKRLQALCPICFSSSPPQVMTTCVFCSFSSILRPLLKLGCLF
jgi:hypothetical protein